MTVGSPPDLGRARPASGAGPVSARRWIAIGVLGLLSLAGGAWLAVHAPVLALRRVEVTGRLVHTDPAAIRAAAALGTGGPVLLADLGGAKRRIERLPWVAEVQVTRRLPGTVRIRVVEREPVAWAAGTDGVPWLVDGTGRVLAPTGTPPDGLVEVRGLDAVGRPGRWVRPRRVVRLLGALDEALGRYVGRVERRRGGVVLVLRAGPDGSVPPVGEVRLGAARQPERQSAVAVAILGAMDERAGYLDVRVPDAPVTGGRG